MRAYIITIGNELLIGDTINTNAAWLGGMLSRYNIEPVKSVVIGDDRQGIVESLDEALQKAEVVILTGGLGPTHDDITKKTLSDYFKAGFVEHVPTIEFIKKVFGKRGIPVSKSNLEQAMVPDNCTVLFNKNGTAPGMWFETNGKVVVSVPGVPTEMKYLMEHEALPRLKEKYGISRCMYRHYFQTAGIGESTLSDLVIGKIDGYLQNGVQLAWLPHTHGVTLRITGEGDSDEKAKQNAEPLIALVREKAAEYIYSEQYADTLEKALGRLLSEKNLTVATAESCTGGLIGNKITDVPGSSAWFRGGLIPYSNDLKTKLLGVPVEIIETHGAVSKETALSMAKNVARVTGADIGIATTGIAGPGGGTDEKPVGLVWFGYYDKERHFAVKALLFKDRLLNKERTALIALDLARRAISGIGRFPYDMKPEHAE